jgi:hypothetical protein
MAGGTSRAQGDKISTAEDTDGQDLSITEDTEVKAFKTFSSLSSVVASFVIGV